MVHAAILLSRASTRMVASSARMRIRTIAPNSRLKPTVVMASGHSYSLAIVEPPEMLID